MGGEADKVNGGNTRLGQEDVSGLAEENGKKDVVSGTDKVGEMDNGVQGDCGDAADKNTAGNTKMNA